MFVLLLIKGYLTIVQEAIIIYIYQFSIHNKTRQILLVEKSNEEERRTFYKKSYFSYALGRTNEIYRSKKHRKEKVKNMIEISGKVVGVINEEHRTFFLVKNELGGFEKSCDVYRHYQSVEEGVSGTFRVEGWEFWNVNTVNWEAVLRIVKFEED